MKMKSLFFGMLALAAMTSCSNNDDEVVVDNGTKAVSLSLNYGATSRAIGDSQTAGAPTLTNVKVEFYSTADGTGAVSQVLSLTNDEVKAPVIKVKAPASANSLRLVAINSAATTLSTSIVDYQGKDVKKDIPYEGIGTIAAGTVKDTYVSTIALNPVAARVEVSGKITPKSANWTITLKGVYANNFLTTLGTPSLFALEGAGGAVTGPLLNGMYDLSTATDWAKAFPTTGNATKCAGYQLFAGSYGVTLQLEVERKTVAPIAKKIQFLVIKSFNKADGDKSNIANLVAGQIYKLNLDNSGLGDMFTDALDPTTPTPDGTKTVDVTVNVAPWTVQNVIPSL